MGGRAGARTGGGDDGGDAGRGPCGRHGRAGRMIRGAVMEMRSNTAEQLDWPIVAPVPRSEPEQDQEQEPQDLTASLAGPNGLDLVVELAHDLRSPLTSILFLAEALQQGQGGAVTQEQSRQLGLIYSAALCLCATASDVLELARGARRAATLASARGTAPGAHPRPTGVPRLDGGGRCPGAGAAPGRGPAVTRSPSPPAGRSPRGDAHHESTSPRNLRWPRSTPD